MAFLAAPEIAELAGSTIGPMLGNKFGDAAGKRLTSLGTKGLESALSSPLFHKKLGQASHKIGNALFGKHHKTARSLMHKAGKIGGALTSQKAHNLLKGGLAIGSDLDLVSKGTGKSILDAHSKAMSVHDQLSKFNKLHKSLTPKYDKHSSTLANPGNKMTDPALAALKKVAAERARPPPSRQPSKRPPPRQAPHRDRELTQKLGSRIGEIRRKDHLEAGRQRAPAPRPKGPPKVGFRRPPPMPPRDV